MNQPKSLFFALIFTVSAMPLSFGAAAAYQAKMAKSRGAAQNSPEGLLAQGQNSAAQAVQLIKQAQLLLGSDVTKEKIEQAISIYTQAGQLFEQTENIFNTLGTKYVKQEDVGGVVHAKEQCIAAIRELSQKLYGQPQPALVVSTAPPPVSAPVEERPVKTLYQPADKPVLKTPSTLAARTYSKRVYQHPPKPGAKTFSRRVYRRPSETVVTQPSGPQGGTLQ